MNTRWRASSPPAQRAGTDKVPPGPLPPGRRRRPDPPGFLPLDRNSQKLLQMTRRNAKSPLDAMRNLGPVGSGPAATASAGGWRSRAGAASTPPVLRWIRRGGAAVAGRLRWAWPSPGRSADRPSPDAVPCPLLDAFPGPSWDVRKPIGRRHGCRGLCRRVLLAHVHRLHTHQVPRSREERHAHPRRAPSDHGPLQDTRAARKSRLRARPGPPAPHPAGSEAAR